MKTGDGSGKRKKTGHITLRVNLHPEHHKDVIKFWEACPSHRRHELFTAAMRNYITQSPIVHMSGNEKELSEGTGS